MMDLGLKNKTALVTGSTKGTGKAIAIELAKEGVDVLINGRNDEEIDWVVNEIKIEFTITCAKNSTADIVDSQQRESLFKKYPNIDILVNNVGIYEIMQYEDVVDEVWEKYFRINVMSLPQMDYLNFIYLKC